MQLVRSLLFYFGYYGFLILHGIIRCVLGPFMRIKTRYRFFLIWNQFCIWWLKVSCGVQYKIIGAENVPPAPFVLLSNHQSPWETLFLYHRFQPLCAILKKELLNLPFFGWGLRLLHPIAIDRNKKGRALQQLLEQGADRINDDISILVFPEGTRVDPGVEKKYSAGGAELAVSTGTLILPIAHNAGLFWPAHKILKRRGTIQVVIGEPIDPAGRKAKEIIRDVESWTRQVMQGM